MADLRKLISSMSRYSTIHQFCTRDGDPITDESITLSEYLASAPTEGGALIDSVGNVGSTAASNLPASSSAGATKTTPDAAGAPTSTTGAGGAPNPVTAPASTASTGSTQLATIYVYYKSPLANRLQQSRQQGGTEKAPALTGVVPRTVTAPTLSPANDADERKLLDTQMTTMRNEFTASSGAQVNKSGVSTLSEDDWTKVLRNSAVFYGWIVDPVTKEIRRAPKAAFQLRRTAPETLPAPADQQMVPNVAVEPNSSQVIEEQADELELPSERAARLRRNAAAREIEATNQQAIASRRVPPKEGKAIPNYRVNDDSKIDMTICRHELAISMAKNDFSSQSTEASVSGGAFGVTVGVSAGYAKSESSSNKTQESTMTQTMVARYMYPRCDLFLYPDDLEPTPELQDLINKIRLTKNIRFLRKLQADFGQLFCQELTLGARLLSTKVMTAKTKADEQTQTESFKVSVGVSVATPFGGGSAKHEQESGGGSANSKTETNTNESNVFEAVGGDTILANNPNLWTTSVAASDNWRIIKVSNFTKFRGATRELIGTSCSATVCPLWSA